ncbi:MAG TPA: quinone oxidoreductase [Alphaproteobacteria bacterium]
MTKAMVMHETGEPSVMKWETFEVPDPGPGEVKLRHTAIGVNFIDIYFRSGLYSHPLPFVTGQEGAGIVTALGKGVKNLKLGDRVAYCGVLGAYAEETKLPADRVVKIPKGISDQTAAAMMLKGMTAQYLLRQVHKVGKGETIVFHAAAGGVGLIACQWAKALGAKVIGTVSTDAKAALAKKHGCTWPIVYTRDNFVDAVNKITKGKKVPVVYDSVGKDTFPGSLDCLQQRGLFVSFGNASGPIPPFNAAILAQKGSLFMTRPSLPHYTGTRAQLEKASGDLFSVVKSGKVKIEVNQTYALKDAVRCHEDLAGRKTTGSCVLIP